MLESLSHYGLVGALAFVALVWGIIVIRAWAPRARGRGGFWYLEAILFLMAPVLESLVFFYPEDLSGPLPMIARAVSLTCVALAIWALLRSSAIVRRGTGTIVAAVLIYYLTMIMSGLVGASPGIPEPYLTTPVLLLAFLTHGGFSADWFLRIVRFNLRLVIGLSLVSALLFPLLAFNTVEPRTLFGVERLAGITAHPNTLGAVAVVALVIEMRNRGSKVWLILPFLTLAFAQSNTAWLALVLALALRRDHLGRALRTVTVAVALVASVAMILFPSKANTLMGTVLDDELTFNGRTRIWDAALIGFQEFPVFGYGPTLLDEGYRARHLPDFDAAAQAHNQLVQSLASAGIVGLLALVVLAVVLFNLAGKLRGLGDSTSLGLLFAIAVRAFAETPLRPTGANLATFLTIAVLGYIAVSWAERSSAARDMDGDSTSPPRSGLRLVDVR